MMVRKVITSERLGHVSIVHVLGDVDLANSTELAEAIESAELSAGPIVLSFVECPYIDSSCLSVVLRAFRRLRERLHVVALPASQVRRIFDVSGVSQALSVRDGFHEAIRASLAPRDAELASL